MTSDHTSPALSVRRRCCRFRTNATATAMDQPAAAWSNVISATSGSTQPFSMVLFLSSRFHRAAANVDSCQCDRVWLSICVTHCRRSCHWPTGTVNGSPAVISQTDIVNHHQLYLLSKVYIKSLQSLQQQLQQFHDWADRAAGWLRFSKSRKLANSRLINWCVAVGIWFHSTAVVHRVLCHAFLATREFFNEAVKVASVNIEAQQ